MLENRNKDMKMEALQKNKAGDKRAALHLMRQVKMHDKELAKLDGQAIMLEQQKMMIESANFDVGVVNSIKSGKDVI